MNNRTSQTHDDEEDCSPLMRTNEEDRDDVERHEGLNEDEDELKQVLWRVTPIPSNL